jgi:Rod binding domain-containing protein
MISSTTGAGSLPAINEAREPAWVRHGSPEAQQAYRTALAFESIFVEQLSKSLAATSGLEGEGQEGGSEGSTSPFGGGNGMLSAMLPQALSSSVMSSGGLGLADELAHSLQNTSAGAAASAAGTGASAAPTTAQAASTNGGSR